MKSESEVEWILSFILGDPEGEQIARRIDETIAKLPGMEWFDRLSASRKEALSGREQQMTQQSGILRVPQTARAGA